MKNDTKKIILQSSLLIVALIAFLLSGYYIPILSYSPDGGIYCCSGFGTGWWFAYKYILITLFVFLPFTALYLIRKKNIKTLDKIFRGTLYLSAFIMLVVFLVNLFPGVEYNYSNEIWSGFRINSPLLYLYNGLLISLVSLIFSVILYIIARINKSLDDKFSFIPTTDNLKINLVGLGILLIISLSFVLWFGTSYNFGSLKDYDLPYENFELAKMAIRETYQLVFMKIVALSSFVFISTFLAIKALPKR